MLASPCRTPTKLKHARRGCCYYFLCAAVVGSEVCFVVRLASMYLSRRIDTLEENTAPPDRDREKHDKAIKELARSARCLSQALPGATRHYTA